MKDAWDFMKKTFPEMARSNSAAGHPRASKASSSGGPRFRRTRNGRPTRSAVDFEVDRAPAGKRLAWLDVGRARSRISTPGAAFMAAGQQAGLDNDQVERLMEQLGHEDVVTPARAAELTGSEKLIHDAALLYAAARHERPSAGAEKGTEAFVSALAQQALQEQLFNPANLKPAERASYLVGDLLFDGSTYSDGNALVNAKGKTVADFARDQALLRLPAFARLSPAERQGMVRDWLDAHGQDTQYVFGTVEHSMASVLKTVALSRGERQPERYASEKALADAFGKLLKDWEGNSVVHPLVLFGLHYAKTSGFEIEGRTPRERLESLQSLVHDVFVEASGPPRFDRDRAAIAILEKITHQSKEEIAHRPAYGSSLLDLFWEDIDNPFLWPYIAASGRGSVTFEETADGAPKYSPRDYLEQAEEKFNAELPSHPWLAAHARMKLRRQNIFARMDQHLAWPRFRHVKLTDEAVAAKVTELVPKYRAQLESASLNVDQDSTAMHWLKNTPIVSMVVGIGEGIAKGDTEEIVSSLPVAGNAYNIYEGVATGDTKRATMAAVTLVPFAGSGYIIADGIANHDAAEIVGGMEGLALDFVTAGEGHLLNRVVGHSALGERRVARTFAPSELPSALRLQAEHSLGAMKDLGMGDRAIALLARSGEHGTAKDPFDLAARGPGARPGPGMAKLLGRLKAVPAEKLARLILRRTGDGLWQDPSTLAHYAQIGSALYRLAKDEAASTPESTIWNPTDPDGNGRNPTIRLEHPDGAWQVAQDVPGLRGGAPKRVRRPMHPAAAKRQDLPYASRRESLARSQVDPSEGPVHVSQTRTVFDAARILAEASDITRYEDFEDKFFHYFTIDPYKARVAGKEHEISATFNFYKNLYDKSQTFRALYNMAERNGYINPLEQWKLSIGEAQLTELNVPRLDTEEDIRTTFAEPFRVNMLARRIHMPTLASPVAHDIKYIAPGGRYVHLPAETTYVHEMVHVLTGGMPDPTSNLRGVYADLLNPDHEGQHYFGERGAVEYLAQRILKEAGINVPPRLSYLVLKDRHRLRMTSVGASDYELLDNYVKLQDDYLATLFPPANIRSGEGEAAVSGSSN